MIEFIIFIKFFKKLTYLIMKKNTIGVIIFTFDWGWGWSCIFFENLLPL